MILLAYAGLIGAMLAATALATTPRRMDDTEFKHQQALTFGVLILALALLAVGLLVG